MYHGHLDYPSRGRLEKMFLKWVAEQKSLRSPALFYQQCNNWFHHHMCLFISYWSS